MTSPELSKNNEELPDVIVGQPLPGLKQTGELDAGVSYDEQVIPTKYGELRYFPIQMRNGTILWAEDSEHSPHKTTVASASVESGTGIVLTFFAGEA